MERTGMEETCPWKKQIREAVVWVGGRCCRARNLLLFVPPHLETPWVISTGDAESGADLIALAEEKLGDAFTSLAEATAGMEVAELLALRSGGQSPAAPLRSIDILLHGDDGNIAMGRPLFSLQEARARAEKAFSAMKRCRGHLGAATLLLGHPAVPGVDDCIEAERASAVSALKAAQQQAEEIETLVRAAYKVLGTTASREAHPDSKSEDV